ncbi:MAG TPA: hypothetical protein VK674_03490 [Candidatus Limnocylindria bacterium]|nr:hypothetical protein [Candidatus Limnocylindria bacterium]
MSRSVEWYEEVEAVAAARELRRGELRTRVFGDTDRAAPITPEDLTATVEAAIASTKGRRAQVLGQKVTEHVISVPADKLSNPFDSVELHGYVGRGFRSAHRGELVAARLTAVMDEAGWSAPAKLRVDEFVNLLNPVGGTSTEVFESEESRMRSAVPGPNYGVVRQLLGMVGDAT